MASLDRVRNLVTMAISFERERAQEDQWNEDVHSGLIKTAMETSLYAETLKTTSLYASLLCKKGMVLTRPLP